MMLLNILPKGAQVNLKIIEFGGIKRGVLGGPDTYVRRLGDRFQATVTLPTTEKHQAGEWIGNRAYGYSVGEHVRLVLPQFVPVDECGSPKVINGAGTAGTYVYLDAQTCGLYKPGQLFSYPDFIHDVVYLHMVTQFLTSFNGYPCLRIAPALRGSPVNLNLEFGNPIIQGFADGLEIDIAMRRFISQQFTIVEGQ